MGNDAMEEELEKENLFPLIVVLSIFPCFHKKVEEKLQFR